ncbi:LOW QUALITY PROTEIN: FUMD-like protein [Mya arenaria]|uniref:FUMD-like protein n=1 Tax=Mya arenaria TaxID=6604 RepID=A0ABY7FTT7_MYAAR|nr:LOW QUALITY PROTEIN: FUMD-like protein [Mya arenaria]
MFCTLLNLVLFISGPIVVEAAKVNKKGKTVKVDCGRVRGIYNVTSRAYSFRGIPYASPPVGNLRWRPPFPVNSTNKNCWRGRLNARKFGSPCLKEKPPFTANTTIGNENCLYLNVWTPSLSRILVTRQQSSWLVTMMLSIINYRLNAFGFMSLDMLRVGSHTNTSGYYGFMDMLTGLHWVQNNIRQFGGDPNQVTPFGQSSGGTAIYALLASPLGRGLFHKA